MFEYNQTRSFNLGIAQEINIEAALIYDDLAYAEQVVGRGNWFYRSYETLLRRLPLMSERTARRAIDMLVEVGYIEKKLQKTNGKPVCHYRIGKIVRIQSAKMTETKESAKMTETYNDKTTNKTTKSNDALLISIINLVNSKEKPTDDRRRQLRARLKDYTEEEILGSARALSQSEWHKEHKQMSIDNLLAPSKFGRWYAQRTDETGRPEVTIANQDEMVRRRLQS